MKGRKGRKAKNRARKEHIKKPVKPLSSTMRRTVNVYPSFSASEREAIMNTMALYQEAFEDFSSYCIVKHTANRKRLQEAIYPAFRALHPEFPSALLQSARDQAVECVKSFNENHPDRKYRFAPGLDGRCTMRYTLRAVSLRGSLLTFSTVRERIRKLITVPVFFLERYPKEDGWRFNSACVGIDRKDRIFATLVYTKAAPAEKELPSENEELEKVTRGHDRGVYNPLSDSDGRIRDSKHISDVKRRYAYDRKTCQEKGTRSAKRRLKSLSGREKRFVKDANHRMSAEAISDESILVHVLENLNGMEKQRERGKKGKKTRKQISRWSYSQLEFDMRYKAQAAGKRVEFVDPEYTSQECSRCGTIDRNARNRGEYHCRKCGLRIQADVNASKVIKKRWIMNCTLPLAVEHGSKGGQAAVNQPGRPGESQAHPEMDGVPLVNDSGNGAVPAGKRPCPSL